jgi:hypothetical protein
MQARNLCTMERAAGHLPFATIKASGGLAMNEYLIWFRTAMAIKRETEQRLADAHRGEVSKPQVEASALNDKLRRLHS